MGPCMPGVAEGGVGGDGAEYENQDNAEENPNVTSPAAIVPPGRVINTTPWCYGRGTMVVGHEREPALLCARKYCRKWILSRVPQSVRGPTGGRVATFRRVGFMEQFCRWGAATDCPPSPKPVGDQRGIRFAVDQSLSAAGGKGGRGRVVCGDGGGGGGGGGGRRWMIAKYPTCVLHADAPNISKIDCEVDGRNAVIP